MAPERSKVGWTAAAHEVAKETFPSLPPGASSSWARAARDEASRKDAETATARRLALMRKLHGKTDGWVSCQYKRSFTGPGQRKRAPHRAPPLADPPGADMRRARMHR